MAGFKKQLMDLLATIPDDDTETTDTGTTEGATEPDTNSEPGEKEIETDVTEEVEVIAPPVDDTDITVITSDDMLTDSIDMRLASFYTKQVELENTVKILLAEVKALKMNFTTIETAIDVASETSPTVENMDALINML